MEQLAHITFSKEQNKLLMDMVCQMKKQLEDLAEIKGLVHQLFSSSLGVTDVTKSTIMSMISIVVAKGKNFLLLTQNKKKLLKCAKEMLLKIFKKQLNTSLSQPHKAFKCHFLIKKSLLKLC